MYRERRGQITAAAILCVAFTLVMIAGVSAFAFVQTSSTLSNGFSVADCSVEIEESFRIPPVVLPGSTIVKEIRFRNTGSGSCFVRASVEFDDDKIAQWAFIDYDEDNWNKGSDGFWYCKHATEEGEATPAICTTITIDQGVQVDTITSFDVLAWGEAAPARDAHGLAFPCGEDAFSAIGQRGIS